MATKTKEVKEEKEAPEGGAPAAPLTLAGRIAAVMGDVHRLEKTGFNSFFKYKFVTAEDVKDLIRPLLAKHGLAIIPQMGTVSREVRVSANGKAKGYIYLKMAYTVSCSDTGEKMVIPWESESQDDEDKGINKALTASLKNFLLNLFQVSTGDEVDIEEVPVVQSDAASPVLLGQIISLYRKANPSYTEHDNKLLAYVFDRICGPESEYTQANAGRVLVALGRHLRPPREQEPVEEAPEEGEEPVKEEN
jgi:hypothetical protein